MPLFTAGTIFHLKFDVRGKKRQKNKKYALDEFIENIISLFSVC